MTPRELIPLDVASQAEPPDQQTPVELEAAVRAARAARWRRELAGAEARLATAAAVLETARQEETDARVALAGREVGARSGTPDPRALAAARTRLRYATTGRELAWLGFHLARARTALSASVLRLVEPAGTRR